MPLCGFSKGCIRFICDGTGTVLRLSSFSSGLWRRNGLWQLYKYRLGLTCMGMLSVPRALLMLYPLTKYMVG